MFQSNQWKHLRRSCVHNQRTPKYILWLYFGPKMAKNFFQLRKGKMKIIWKHFLKNAHLHSMTSTGAWSYDFWVILSLGKSTLCFAMTEVRLFKNLEKMFKSRIKICLFFESVWSIFLFFSLYTIFSIFLAGIEENAPLSIRQSS